MPAPLWRSHGRKVFSRPIERVVEPVEEFLSSRPAREADPLPSGGRSRSAARAGDSVNETRSEMMVADAIVSAN